MDLKVTINMMNGVFEMERNAHPMMPAEYGGVEAGLIVESNGWRWGARWRPVVG